MNLNFKDLWFDQWKWWIVRDRPSQDVDVPADFGMFGIYVLARFVSQPTEKNFDPYGMPKEVLYIGMSSHVDRRLERSHTAVRKYRKETGDDLCKKLWYVRAYSPWNNRSLKQISTATAHVAYYERALILSYVNKYGALPKYNRR